MANEKYTLNGMHRFWIVHHIVPRWSGSIDEMRCAVTLKKRLAFTGEEKKSFGIVEQGQGAAIQNNALAKAAEREDYLTEEEAGLIASGILLNEAQEKLPNDEAYDELVAWLADRIEEAKDEG